jgi:hypothetical protein
LAATGFAFATVAATPRTESFSALAGVKRSRVRAGILICSAMQDYAFRNWWALLVEDASLQRTPYILISNKRSAIQELLRRASADLEMEFIKEVYPESVLVIIIRCVRHP